MSQRTLRTYYDSQADRFVLPTSAHCPLRTVQLPQRDVVRFEVVMLGYYDVNRTEYDTSGLPKTAYQKSIADVSSFLLALKTKDQYDEADDFTVAWSGFTGTDLANGRCWRDINLPVADVPAGVYFLIPQLLYASGAVWTLGCGNERLGVRTPIIAVVAVAGLAGDEASTPSGLPTSISGNFVIADGNVSVDITVTGITASPQVLITQKDTGVGTTLFQYSRPAADTLRISAGAVADASTWAGTYLVQVL